MWHQNAWLGRKGDQKGRAKAAEGERRMERHITSYHCISVCVHIVSLIASAEMDCMACLKTFLARLGIKSKMNSSYQEL